MAAPPCRQSEVAEVVPRTATGVGGGEGIKYELAGRGKETPVQYNIQYLLQ